MPGPGAIYEAVERFRDELLRGERAAASAMTHAYGEAWQRVRVEIERLARQYYEAQAAGREPASSWLFQRGRLASLQQQVEHELARVMQDAEAGVRAQQLEAAAAAGRHARDAVETAVGADAAVEIMPRWDMLPSEAFTSLVGFSADGTPLGNLLGALPGEAGQAVRRGLLEGLLLGHNPRRIARAIRADLGGNLARALTISRTETLRAYREATYQNYLANSELLSGWVWLSARGPRTCLICLAMDGTVHPLSERLVDHPNGRCCAAPVVKGYPLTERQTGEQWLAGQNEYVQRQTLGDANFEVYREGRITLRDLVTAEPVEDADWGARYQRRTLTEVLGADEAQRWAQIARWEKLDDEQLIPAIVRSQVQPSRHLLERVSEYVAGRGFDPQHLQPIDRQVVGLEWQGQVLQLGDRLPVLEQHFLKHVVARAEWPESTTLADYINIAREVVTSRDSGVLAARVRNRWNLFFIEQRGSSMPHAGSDWTVVQYSVAQGHWWSVYRLWRGPEQLTGLAGQEGSRWLRNYR